MYSNPGLVRKLTPLLTTEAISDSDILEFINQADSILNQALAKRYVVPVTAKISLTGAIAITAGSATITGSGTAFLSELYPGDIICALDTREVFKVLSIASNTSLTVTSNALYSDASSTFFVMPREIVTASQYYSAMLIILTHFSEQAYNQETGAFNNQYALIAEKLIDSISSGDYLNVNLAKQSDSASAARYIIVNTANDIRSFTDDAEKLIIESFPGV